MSTPLPKVPDWPGNCAEESRWLDEVVAHLESEDGPADEQGAWPDRLWRTVRASGGLQWLIPRDLGGDPCAYFDLLRRYGRLAEGSLTAAFLLSQHDGAVKRLLSAQGAGRATAEKWLRAIARGEASATVGISHLTTSRRLGTRALSAREKPNGGYVLEGAMPWVTGAVHAQVIVTGALLPDGRQILVALPTDRSHVTVEPPFALAALQAACTSEVMCDAVNIAADEVLLGPDNEIKLAPGQVGTGGLETSALALGQARAALQALSKMSAARPDLVEPTDALCAEWHGLAWSLLAAAEGQPDAPTGGLIRSRANSLVLRATQAFLTARKGTGFLRSDPAQRWARQALFFLVWSCPAALADQAVRGMAGLCET